MTISRQWRYSVLMVVAVVAVIFEGFVEGSTDASSCAAILCPTNTTCDNGTCKLICESGYADCNGQFNDGCEANLLEGDVTNCGKCGRNCAEPKSYEFVNCVGGKCTYTDKCTAIKCGTYPNADTFCTKGKCGAKCHPGYANCDGILEIGKNGCEVNLNKDVKNCGKCKHKCPKPQGYGAGPATCRNGVCQ
ncbi:hypothetical protein M758_8G033100 [Ceratodon purpureus]|nr:hypothetical protein M758_8G033100 [Ceratodon purpureus]